MGVIIGNAVKNPKLGQEFLPLLFVLQILFSGFYVAPDLIPDFLCWAPYLCTLTYAVRILLVEEFDHDCGSVRGNINCQDLLESVDAVPEDTWCWYWTGWHWRWDSCSQPSSFSKGDNKRKGTTIRDLVTEKI
jgi:hypothetical protein